MKVDEDIQAVHQQIASAYQLMAIKVGYRPEPTSQGYASQWWKEETSQKFNVGCCDMETRRATIYAIEAARLLCAGLAGQDSALALLKLAVKELTTVMAENTQERDFVVRQGGRF
jgi:hypothetical protein